MRKRLDKTLTGPIISVQRRRDGIKGFAVILSRAKDPTEPQFHGGRGVLRFAQRL
jgi:hypothetical protein